MLNESSHIVSILLKQSLKDLNCFALMGHLFGKLSEARPLHMLISFCCALIICFLSHVLLFGCVLGSLFFGSKLLASNSIRVRVWCTPVGLVSVV